MKDLINLSCSCQEVTVVSDFSDLEKIGHRHFLNTNGGMADPTLARKKSREVALNLLWNDRSGTITPYGVGYENNLGNGLGVLIGILFCRVAFTLFTW